ncbi:ADP-ribosyltransferase exoenzyme [Shewanella psychrophila]|uniref:ADP-ribosyltransferase exoenzyme n=1 Tax=Shewanella psychrophila TaxID=225848 RepID=A0A1S6HJH4_9GAMM|nr:ADP-ribosyltransferase [Shewanella psychrophila]AQS35659.1 ADP-ribosyltransferase exoenzyme [Shewanella psychrophila]
MKQILTLIVSLTFSLYAQVLLALPLDALKQPMRTQQELALLSEQFKDWSVAATSWRHKLLTATEKSALEDFSVSGYITANDHLRASDGAEWGAAARDAQRYIRQVRRGLVKLPRYKGTVFRGSWMKQSLAQKLNVGDVLVDPAFMSTSTLPEMVIRFAVVPPSSALPMEKAFFEINAQHGSYTLAGISEFSPEAEVLLTPKRFFRVTALEKMATGNFIAMDTLAGAPSNTSRVFNLFSGEEVSSSRWQRLICR